jgi:WD40 repeat protein
MRKGLADKISLTLSIFLVLTIAFTAVEWIRNAFQTHKSWVYSVGVKDDGTIASASDDQILLWKKRYCIDSLVEHTDAIKSISFSHDNQFLVSGSIDKTVRVWLITDNRLIETFNAHTAGVNKVKFSSTDKYIVSAGYDDKLYIWDWRNKERVKDFNVEHTEFSISNSDMLAFVDTTCNLNFFDLTSLSTIKTVGRYCGAPIFHPNDTTLAIRTDDGRIQFVNSYSGELESELDIKHETHYGPLAFTPDGFYIVAGIWGGDIEIWDWHRKELAETLHGTFATSTEEFAFNSKGQLLSASGDRSVKSWDLDSGNLKSNIGDGLYQKQLVGILSILFGLTLAASFFGVSKSSTNKYSSWIVISILTVWSFGILTLGLHLQTRLVKYSKVVVWTLTVISGLAIWSLYGAWLAIYIIPVSLFFGYIKLKLDRDSKEITIPIALNLIYCGVLISFVVSAGLWR